MELEDIYIPLARGDLLSISPYEVDDSIVDILRAEQPPLRCWLDSSKALIAQGRDRSFLQVLDEAIKKAGREVVKKDEKFPNIQALCTLAAYHIEQGRLVKDTTAQSNEEQKARKLLIDAQKIDQTELLPHLGLGELALNKKDWDGARKEFEAAARLKCNGKSSVAGILALARFRFARDDIRQALALYQQALQKLPAAPPEVRLGIAACHFKLGEAAKADAAFTRVLELDPDCTQALLGLAALKLAVGADADAIKEGSQLLARAFQLDPDSPRTLCLLAQFTIRQGFPEKARILAQAAVERSQMDEDKLKAEALTTLGRAYHATGQLNEAYQCYQKATQMDRSLPLPRFGLVQFALISGKQSTQAVRELESILKDVPAWVDALKLLGTLIAKGVEGEQLSDTAAKQIDEEATRQGDNPDLWELLGDALAATKPSAALLAYQKAVKLHRAAAASAAAVQQGEANGSADGAPLPHVYTVPARLLNNAGVLLMQSGETTASRGLIHEALSSAEAGGMGEMSTFAQVTLGYNLARLKEAAGNAGEAEKEYKALVDQFPQYADCYLRLAAIAKNKGDIKGAEHWAHQAAEKSGRSADALALLAAVHLERKDYEAATVALSELDELTSKGASKSGHKTEHKDGYYLVAKGNVHLASAPADRKKEDNRSKASKQLGHALASFTHALEKDPGNVYAANGIGCVLAEAGRFTEAKEVFLQVQAAVASTSGFYKLPDAWVNLANVYLGLQDYEAAGKAYTTALKRFYDNKNARVLLYVAKTRYDSARTDTETMRSALKIVLRALHLEPWDHKLRFNVAHLLSESATRELGRPRPKGDPTKVADFRRALADLSHANDLFLSLNLAGKEVTGLDSKRLQSHVEHCNERYQSGLKYVQAAERDQQLRDQQRQLILDKEAAAAAQRHVEEMRKAAEEEAARRGRLEASKAHAERIERINREMKQSAVMRKAVETGDVTEIQKGRADAGRASAGGVDAVDALFAEDSEEDMEYQPGQESGDEDGGGGADDGGGTAALLATAGLVSDDDEDDFDFNADEEGPEDDGGLSGDEGGGGKAQKNKKRGADGGKSGVAKKKKKVEKAEPAVAKKRKLDKEGGGRLKRTTAAAGDAAVEEEMMAVTGNGDALEDDLEDDMGGDGGDVVGGDVDTQMEDIFGSDSD